jgi:hypothetical protein
MVLDRGGPPDGAFRPSGPNRKEGGVPYDGAMRLLLAVLLMWSTAPAFAITVDEIGVDTADGARDLIGANNIELPEAPEAQTVEAEPAPAEDPDGTFLMTGPQPPMDESQYNDDDRRAKAVFDAIRNRRPVPAAEVEWARDNLLQLRQAIQSPEYEAQGMRFFQKSGRSHVTVQYPDGRIARMNARQFVDAQRQLLLQQIENGLRQLQQAVVR